MRLVRKAAARSVLAGLGVCISQAGAAQQETVDATRAAAATSAATPAIHAPVLAPMQAPKGDACSQAFHAALLDIHQRHVMPAREALTAARRAQAGASGTWLFGPHARRDRSTARSAGRSSPVNPSKTELALYRQADPWVKSRGQIAHLQFSTPLGGVVSRMTRELQAYTGQPPHRALCAGAPEMSEHLARQAAYVERQTSTWALSAEGGLALAHGRVAALRLLNATTSPTTVTASMAPVVTGTIAGEGQPAVERSLQELIGETARIALPAREADAVASQETPLAALRELFLALREHGGAPVPDGLREPLVETLGTLEATAYVTRSVELVTRLREGLSGGVRAIREAHARHCVCAPVSERRAEP